MNGDRGIVVRQVVAFPTFYSGLNESSPTPGESQQTIEEWKG